ncbi:MAG: DUF3892 domain-containing protein [Proteobacteria bacterium]|nr:DUF3892 domain-containing protein [Pseudomonadota bacterium]
MSIIDEYKKRVKGMVRNHSSKILWVIETDTGKPKAHKLGPKRKSPKGMDADGFKRFDGKSISNHPHWWKIYNFSTADVFDRGKGVTVIGYKVKVADDEFDIKDGNGKSQIKVEYDYSDGWGDLITYIIGVKRGKNGSLEEFNVDNLGWISKFEAIALVEQEKIDNAVVVRPKSGEPYLRSRPDRKKENNFSQMVV